MKNAEKTNSPGHFSVLAGLWLINILILILGFPFLIYKKVREIYSAPKKNRPRETKPSSAGYFPCRMDS